MCVCVCVCVFFIEMMNILRFISLIINCEKYIRKFAQYTFDVSLNICQNLMNMTKIDCISRILILLSTYIFQLPFANYSAYKPPYRGL